MKPVISYTDYNILKSLVTNYPAHLKTKEIGQLMDELASADIVDDSQMNDDIIRLNSYFEAEDVHTKRLFKLTITLPEQANLKEHKISVFSPLGIALLGFKKGMTIEWSLPGGRKTIKIVEVVNQASI